MASGHESLVSGESYQCMSWGAEDPNRNRPGSTLHAVETLRSPRWEDFDYEYEEASDDPIKGNRLGWLGNGWSDLQIGEGKDVSYYIEDSYVDVPSAPRPEETPRWTRWSYSH